jgi:cobalamin biosynthesis protein CobD/CbiB
MILANTEAIAALKAQVQGLHAAIDQHIADVRAAVAKIPSGDVDVSSDLELIRAQIEEATNKLAQSNVS